MSRYKDVKMLNTWIKQWGRFERWYQIIVFTMVQSMEVIDSLFRELEEGNLISETPGFYRGHDSLYREDMRVIKHWDLYPTRSAWSL